MLCASRASHALSSAGRNVGFDSTQPVTGYRCGRYILSPFGPSTGDRKYAAFRIGLVTHHSDSFESYLFLLSPSLERTNEPTTSREITYERLPHIYVPHSQPPGSTKYVQKHTPSMSPRDMLYPATIHTCSCMCLEERTQRPPEGAPYIHAAPPASKAGSGGYSTTGSASSTPATAGPWLTGRCHRPRHNPAKAGTACARR